MTLAEEVLALCELEDGVQLATDAGKSYSRYKAVDKLADMYQYGHPHLRKYASDYTAFLAGKGKMPDDSKVGHRTAEHIRSHVKHLYHQAGKQ